MKVKSITYAGKSDVYNLHVKETHNFLANGVVVHNCYDEVRYLCMARPVPLRQSAVAPRKVFDPYGR